MLPWQTWIYLVYDTRYCTVGYNNVIHKYNTLGRYICLPTVTSQHSHASFDWFIAGVRASPWSAMTWRVFRWQRPAALCPACSGSHPSQMTPIQSSRAAGCHPRACFGSVGRQNIKYAGRSQCYEMRGIAWVIVSGLRSDHATLLALEY